jgi:hypothetical protein
MHGRGAGGRAPAGGGGAQALGAGPHSGSPQASIQGRRPLCAQPRALRVALGGRRRRSVALVGGTARAWPRPAGISPRRSDSDITYPSHWGGHTRAARPSTLRRARSRNAGRHARRSARRSRRVAGALHAVLSERAAGYTPRARHAPPRALGALRAATDPARHRPPWRGALRGAPRGTRGALSARPGGRARHSGLPSAGRRCGRTPAGQRPGWGLGPALGPGPPRAVRRLWEMLLASSEERPSPAVGNAPRQQ